MPKGPCRLVPFDTSASRLLRAESGIATTERAKIDANTERLQKETEPLVLPLLRNWPDKSGSLVALRWFRSLLSDILENSSGEGSNRARAEKKRAVCPADAEKSAREMWPLFSLALVPLLVE